MLHHFKRLCDHLTLQIRSECRHWR
jgi:hypothetical protein